MKTIKITEKAWEKLSLFKTYNKKKTFSEAIETAVFYASITGLPLGTYEIKKQAINEGQKKINKIKKIWGVEKNDKSKK